MKSFLRILCTLLLACCSFSAFAQTNIYFDTAGTYNWVCPVGVTSITLQMWGGGGQGNYLNSGGGGSFVQTTAIPVTPGNTYKVKVGNYVKPFVAYDGYTAMSVFSVTETDSVFAYGAISWFSSTVIGGAANTTGNYVAASYKGGDGANSFDGTQTLPSGGAAAASSCGTGANGNYGGAPGTGVCGGGSGGNGQSVPPSEGKFPGGGGGSGWDVAAGACGRIILTYTCNTSAGTIGNAHTVANPQELSPDKISSTADPVLASGATIAWEQSIDNVHFVPAKTNTTVTTYRFDNNKLKTTTYYRRGNNGCVSGGNGNWSNTVRIVVASYNNGNGIQNGKFTGYIRARNGDGIAARKVFAKNLTLLKGRPVGYLDSATTDANGFFHMDSVFYGDRANTEAKPRDSANVRFLIYSDTADHHLYKPFDATLSTSSHEYPVINIIDSSSFGVTGQVYQICDSCLNANNKVVKIQGPLDSVIVKGLGVQNSATRDEFDSSKTGYRTDKGSYGNYSLIFQYTDKYTITPTYLNHKFKPKDTTFSINGAVANLNFIDTSTHVISGVFSAGCGDVIGSAVLEFDDSLHVGYDSLPQTSVFRKRVTTDANGKYSIRLPARAYTVQVINWSGKDNSDASTTQKSIIKYFNALRNDTLLVDSVYRDISSHDTILNLMYHRAPQITISGLKDDSLRVSTCSAFANYDFWPQGIRRPIMFNVYQGPAKKGCLLDTGVVTIRTDISKNTGFFSYDTVPVINGIATDSIVAAQPNIVVDPKTGTYSKVITAKYTDIINRSFSTDTLKPKLPIIVVTGAAIDPSGTNFVTVTPELPMLVLHDPPGSNSNAEWEQEISSSKTVSFSAKTAESQGESLKAKIGLSEIIGLFVEIPVKVEIGLDADFNTTKSYANTDETTITNTSAQSLKTSEDPAYIGRDADVVWGQAMNIAYREGTEIDWDSATCKILDPKPVIVTDVAGVGTTYDYTIGSIRDEEIPRLEKLAVATSNPDSARFYRDQEGVWQQLIDQNDENIKSAPVITNKSFSNGSSYTSKTSLTNDSKNTYQFDVDIDSKIAADVGFEIAGTGLTAGVSVGFSTTIGGDSTYTSGTTTTTSYTLADNNAGLAGNYSGDYVSVNIKKDPVYGTPMFETYAGGTQCPHEEGTVSLYHPLITADVTELKNVTRDTANFTLYLNNLSNDAIPGGKRSYVLFVNQSSNSDGAAVLINNLGAPDGVSFPIPNNGGQQKVTISVIRNKGGSVYDYDNLELIMTDPCFTPVVQGFYGNPHEYSSIKLSADFASPVSGVNLVSPANNWVSNKSNHDSVAVMFNGYTLANLLNISIQYNVPGSNIWTNIATLGKSKLGATSTTFYWKTSKVSDGAYNLRLQVMDNLNRIVYSPVASGVIDRTAPSIFGVPKPASGNYVAGTQISFSYTEKINTAITAGMINLRDLTTNTVVATQLSAFDNKIIIVPSTNIAANTGDRYRVIIKNVSDRNGNVKATPDTAYFTVGAQTINTGTNVLNVTTTPGSIYEDSKGSLVVRFTRNAKATDTSIIYYTIAGNAILNKDYTVTYNKGQDTNSVTGINGSDGQIRLLKDSLTVTMYIHPVNDSIVTPDKILSIFLNPGGEYTIGSNYSVADTILNHNLPAPTITANNSTTLCSGDSVTLSTNSKLNGESLKYLWSTGEKTKTIVVKQSGSYTVKVTGKDDGLIGYSTPTVVTITCSAPIGLKVKVSSKSKAILSWNKVDCAKKYVARHRQSGTNKWTTDTLAASALTDTLTGLKANTTYEWQVQSICKYPVIIASTYAAGDNFTTPASLQEIAVTNTEDYKQASAGDGFAASIYPNPASTSASLQVKGARGPYNVILMNMQGEVLWKAENLTGSYVKIPLNTFASDVYMVVVTDKLHTGKLKLVKQ